MADATGKDGAIPDTVWENMGLTKFSGAMASQFVQKNVSTIEAAHEFERVHDWLLSLAEPASRRKTQDSFQAGCPEMIPGLRAFPSWSLHLLPQLQTWLSEQWLPNKAAVLAEVQALRRPMATSEDISTMHGFQEYRAPSWAAAVVPRSSADSPHPDQAAQGAEASEPSHASAAMGSSSTSSGQWNVYYLDLHNVDTSDNRALCPVLASVLDALPGQYGHAFLSAMAPGTHITPHHGPTNKKLRMQLPLSLPPGATPAASAGGDCNAVHSGTAVRVAKHTLRYSPSEPLVFDDSFEHEAWNMCSQPRLVLIADIWHPDLTPPELKFLQFLRKAQLRAAKALSAAATKQGMVGVDFFAILQDAKNRPVDAGAVLGDAAAAET